MEHADSVGKYMTAPQRRMSLRTASAAVELLCATEKTQLAWSNALLL